MEFKEHQTQCACVQWFRLAYPKFLIYSIPNARKVSKVQGARLVSEGVVSGIPDLHIPIAKKGFHGLYIEMKAGNNKPSPNQITIMDKLRNEGYKCVVCWNLDEFMKEVIHYLD